MGKYKLAFNAQWTQNHSQSNFNLNALSETQTTTTTMPVEKIMRKMSDLLDELLYYSKFHLKNHLCQKSETTTDYIHWQIRLISI